MDEKKETKKIVAKRTNIPKRVKSLSKHGDVYEKIAYFTEMMECAKKMGSKTMYNYHKTRRDKLIKMVTFRIENKLEQLASKSPYRQVKYVALRKEFNEVPLSIFLEALEEVPASYQSSQHNFWSKRFDKTKFRNIRTNDKRAIHAMIKMAKERGTWDGVTLNDVEKYMRELENAKGYKYAISHSYIFMRRKK